MVERLHTARKWMFYLMGYLEYAVSALVLIGVLFHLANFIPLWYTIPEEGLDEYLKFLFDALIGIELIKLLCRNDLYSMVEVLLFAVTRHLIMEHLPTLEILIGILAIVALFAIRKFLFIHQETYEKEQHRREYMD